MPDQIFTRDYFFIFYFFILYYDQQIFNDYNMRICIEPMWNVWIVNCITNSCFWNTYVTWQSIDHKLPEDDTIVSKHVGLW
jgi:hypothetical protein